MTTRKTNAPRNLLMSSTDQDMQKVLKTVAKRVDQSVKAAEKAHQKRLQAIKYRSRAAAAG